MTAASSSGIGVLSKPDPNMPTVAQFEDAIDSSPAHVAYVVAADSPSATERVVEPSSSTAVASKESIESRDAMVSSLPVTTLTEVPNSLPLDSVAHEQALREFFPGDEDGEYISVVQNRVERGSRAVGRATSDVRDCRTHA
eukprot:IDg8467t1